MQIAGSRCRICEREIILSDEGKFCDSCGYCVHRGCESRSVCAACGKPFEFPERLAADPLANAVVPRALRPTKSAAPLLAVLMVLLMMLLFYYLMTLS